MSEVLYNSSCTSMDKSAQYLFCHFLFGKDREFSRWPQSTKIACWHCCGPFSGVPVSVPKFYDAARKQWELQGVYCSLACAKRAILNDDNFNTTTVMMWFRLFCREVLGIRKADSIAAAPPRAMLLKFGGPLSLNKFRSMTRGNESADARAVSAEFEAVGKPFLSWPFVTLSSVPMEVTGERQMLQHVLQPTRLKKRPGDLPPTAPTQTQGQTQSQTPTPVESSGGGIYAKFLSAKEGAASGGDARETRSQTTRQIKRRKKTHAMRLRSSSGSNCTPGSLQEFML